MYVEGSLFDNNYFFKKFSSLTMFPWQGHMASLNFVNCDNIGSGKFGKGLSPILSAGHLGMKFIEIWTTI